MHQREELEVIQKVYDFIKWISPLINRMPRDRKFTIGDRLLNHWYDMLEMLLEAKYSPKPAKKQILIKSNLKLEKIRFFHRLLKDEKIWDMRRFKYTVKKVDEIGVSIGGWIKKR